jgi:lipopolysaccharide transport system permease protein
VDFAIAFVILIGMMLWYGIRPGFGILLLPLVLAFIALAALGVGTILSALTVAYRDFRYVVPFLVQIWLFVTPVIYPANMVAERWQWVLALNPMSGLIEAFRFALLGSVPSSAGAGQGFELSRGNLVISCFMTLLAFLAGTFYFRRLERQFADIV